MNAKIGLEKGIVRLEPHRPEWKNLFETEKARILDAIVRAKQDGYIVSDHEIIVDCQHIGSTAIPNIVTKPIIDIGLSVTKFEEGYALVNPLERLGYKYHGENGVPHRHYFDYGDPCTIHLHVFGQDSQEWKDHILFRDYMIAHPEDAVKYERLKIELAEKYRTDRVKYTDGKAVFIQEIITQAKTEKTLYEDKKVRMKVRTNVKYIDSLENITASMMEGFFVGWPNPPSTATHLKLLQGSDVVILAVDEEAGRVVGFIAALTDHVLTAFLPLLEVLPEYQGMGIGGELVERITEKLKEMYSVDLICDEDLVEYYKRWGFKPGCGMMLRNYVNQSGAGEK